MHWKLQCVVKQVRLKQTFEAVSANVSKTQVYQVKSCKPMDQPQNNPVGRQTYSATNVAQLLADRRRHHRHRRLPAWIGTETLDHKR